MTSTETPPRIGAGWVLGRRADFLIFSGPIGVGFALLYWARLRGLLDDPLPPWLFALLIIGCDVAHVYATMFRVYLDPMELRRRSGLYVGVPLGCFAVGSLLHSIGPTLFWRVLAYLALFHFVRQQWGWVAYSRRAAGETDRWERRFDQIAIYNATLFPLIWWHAHLPRDFVWFVSGDFVEGLPTIVSEVGFVAHFGIWALYLAWQLRRAMSGVGVNVGKLQIVFTTWLAWFGGIVSIGTDLSFTTLNVLSHAIPYLAVVHHLERQRRFDRPANDRQPDVHRDDATLLDRLFAPRGWILFLALLVIAGIIEEWLWDRLVWHDHAMLFLGPAVELEPKFLALVVPLLAVPQATHYVLDGSIWRTASREDLRRFLAR